jgi:hypothetical protein
MRKIKPGMTGKIRPMTPIITRPIPEAMRRMARKGNSDTDCSNVSGDGIFRAMLG